MISTSYVSGQQTSSASQGGQQALFLVQLTDPPVVPAGTTSLNLTYSAINLIVSEQTSNNQVTTKNVTITPQGGSATVDLLRLQNVSQTIASANLPNGTTVYSVSFTVTKISIDVNGTTSPVTLATGGNTFRVTLAQPAVLDGTTAALVELNPIVVNTPTGYQIVPSAVGVVKGHSSLTSEDDVIGSRHQLTNQDKSDLDQAKGRVSARLVGLSVSGNTTAVSVQINNTGGLPVRLTAIGLHGNFTSQGPGCMSYSTTSSTSTNSTSTSTTSNSTRGTNTTSTSVTRTSGHGTNTTSTTTRGGDNENGQNSSRTSNAEVGRCNGGNEVVFVPLLAANSNSSTSSSSASSTSSTSSTSTTAAKTCTTGQMGLVNGNETANGDDNGTTLAPGKCIILTFTGTISFGQSPVVIIPSTTSGQTYTLHVIASNSAETMLNCVLPLTNTSCTVTNPRND